jgi:hypothetical protein
LINNKVVDAKLFDTKSFGVKLLILGSGWLQAGWLGRLAGIPVLTSKNNVFGSLEMQDFTI